MFHVDNTENPQGYYCVDSDSVNWWPLCIVGNPRHSGQVTWCGRRGDAANGDTSIHIHLWCSGICLSPTLLSGKLKLIPCVWSTINNHVYFSFAAFKSCATLCTANIQLFPLGPSAFWFLLLQQQPSLCMTCVTLWNSSASMGFLWVQAEQMHLG